MGIKEGSEEKNSVIPNVESPIGQNVNWVNRIYNAFPAFESGNYRKYFIGQLISMIGTWMQIVAQSWLVLQLTDSVFLIGMVMALSTLPTLFFTLFGGVIVDRFPKKDILFATQIAAMILAFLLGVLTIFDWINIWEICIISFCLGTVNAIDAPARQAFVSELVNKEQLSSAIALNSGVFNSARVIGPTIAGILIAIIGTGGAFLINAVSYVAVLFALKKITLNTILSTNISNPITAIKEGIRYSLTHPIIRTLFLVIGIVSIFGWSYTTVLPVIAKNIFHVDAAGLGYLYAASGLGSLLATIVIALYSKKVSPLYFIVGGTLVFSISIFLFSFTNDFNTASLLMFFSGFGLLAFASQANTTIQMLVKSEFRGRVMSIYVLMFIGLTPIGNFQVGLISEYWGTSFALQAGAIIVLIAGLVVFLLRNRIIDNYRGYKTTQAS
jgi:MFS family permease